MTSQELEGRLRHLCPQTYQLAAPRDATRYIVIHEYGRDGVSGSDTTALTLPKVQLDIITQNLTDPLPEDVGALLEALCLPYEVIDVGYDDEYAAMRCIIQLVVV